jgi:hypothetical protein
MALKKELTKVKKRDELEYESLLPEHQNVYGDIEHLIITWSLDGTKTAGTLTRRIMKKLAKHKLINVTKNGKKTNK